MGREVINVHIGQAGLALGTACWELFCAEHGVSTLDGSSLGEEESFSGGARSCLFAESAAGGGGGARFVPRAVLLDLDGEQLHRHTSAGVGAIFRRENAVGWKEDSGNLHVYGGCVLGSEISQAALEALRREAERCDALAGFLWHRSTAGGTGSGLGDRLLQRCPVEFGSGVPSVGISLLPGLLRFNTVAVSPFNAVVCLANCARSLDANLLFDNDALYDMCRGPLGLQDVSLADINRLIARSVSALTAPLRFGGTCNSSLEELRENLVPVKGANMVLSSLAPLAPAEEHGADCGAGEVAQLTRPLFRRGSLSVGCPLSRHRFLACSVVYRGLLQEEENEVRVGEALAEVHGRPSFRFAAGGDIQWGVTPGASRSAHMLCNSTAVEEPLRVLVQQHDQLRKACAYMHWYEGSGMSHGFMDCEREELVSTLDQLREMRGEVPSQGGQEAGEDNEEELL